MQMASEAFAELEPPFKTPVLRRGVPLAGPSTRQASGRPSQAGAPGVTSLDTLDWSEAMKDMQRNWIGKSEGALVDFLIPGPSPKEKGADKARFMTADSAVASKNLTHAREMRKEPTETEELLWQNLRDQKLGFKFRRQHLIDRT